ncbi:MAG: hypothetical protein M1821_004662 [Bathelium mastoideum]|nr:MAG: hypothetical protein M1821_004662 [Bathelium mastoideum]
MSATRELSEPPTVPTSPAWESATASSERLSASAEYPSLPKSPTKSPSSTSLLFMDSQNTTEVQDVTEDLWIRMQNVEANLGQQKEQSVTQFEFIQSHTKMLEALYDKSNQQMNQDQLRLQQVLKVLSTNLECKDENMRKLEEGLASMEQKLSIFVGEMNETDTRMDDIDARLRNIDVRVEDMSSFNDQIRELKPRRHQHNSENMFFKINETLLRHGQILVDMTCFQSDATARVRSSVAAGAWPCCGTIGPCKHNEPAPSGDA